MTATTIDGMDRPAIRLRADSRLVVYTVAALVAALGITSLIASFHGLIAVAEWALLPPGLRWTVPVSLDGAILVYTAVALVRRDRGESTRLAWGAVGAGTALSAAANGVHVVVDGGVALHPAAVTGIGAGVAALAPVLAACAVHALADLAIAPPVRRSARRPAVRRPTPASASSTASPAVSAPAPAPRPVAARAGSSRGDRDALRAEALRLASEGRSQRQIAEKLAVGKSTVARWLSEGSEATA